MAEEHGSKIPDLIQTQFSPEKRFSFYQAVRLMLEHTEAESQPGTRDRFDGESIFFRANPSMGFPSRDVQQIQHDLLQGSLPGVVFDVNFMGLYGPSSPIPAYYTEEILHSDPEDSEVRRFLDLFNHRLISYLYRSWQKYRMPLHYQPGATDKYSEKLYSFIGLKDSNVRNNSRIDWERLLPFIGLLGMRTGAAKTITSLVAFYCGIEKVSLIENVEQLLEIPEQQRVQLGVSNSTLGENTSLGERIRDCNSRFELRLEELEMQQYLNLLPGQRLERDINELIKFISKDSIDYTLSLSLKHDQAQPMQLADEQTSGLGRNAWIGAPKQKQTTINFA